MYIENIICPRSRYEKLLKAFMLDPRESEKDNRAVCPDGILIVYHDSYAKIQGQKRSVKKSVFTDFEVIKLYNRKPTEEDQIKYQRVMSEIFQEYGYDEKLEEFKRNQIDDDSENDEENY